MTTSDNPVLDTAFRIPFHRIQAEHVVPGIRRLLRDAQEAAETLADDPSPPDWTSTIQALDRLIERVDRGTGPVQHLLSVSESPELRAAWGEILPDLTRFWSTLFLHEGIWRRLKAFAESSEAGELDPLRARHLNRTLAEFRRAGADLSEEGRLRLEDLDVEMARLQQTFSENVLDATAAFALDVDDEGRLVGIPEDARERFRKRAQEAGVEGWRLTLDQPSFEAVVLHAEDRELRRDLHQAYVNRCRGGEWDNLLLIPKILRLRQERAKLLGYPDFPDYRLEEHMVGSGSRARAFVAEVAARTRPYWLRDFGELEAHGEKLGITPVEPWDVAFLIERLRQERFELDQEDLRPYFPLPSVLDGLFEITNRLFGLRVKQVPLEEVWHPEANYYELADDGGEVLGGFYTDFFPRPEKRQGAWMNDFIHGAPTGNGRLTPHLGVICANFAPPSDHRPALLTHRDVQTLFHEFGHLLHHLTSRVPIGRRGGARVAWDWVELPSQLLENWTWEREALDVFARHWETGDRLPRDLFDRMTRARRFMGGWRQMRQLGFGTLDLAIHSDFDPDSDGDPVAWVSRVLEPLSPNERFAEAHPLPSFLHIFSGGYAASYYAYMWSEVLEADLFTRFRERGIFDPPTGRTYLETILSTGDSEEPEVLFRRFMGRDPDPEALILRNLGDAA
jgi:oligopeptidase A